jgi:hypothetical protein
MCRIRLCTSKFVQYFFETNIMSLSKFSTSKLEKRRFSKQILLLSSQIIFRILKKANAFWMIARNLRSWLTVAIAKCHFEGIVSSKKHVLRFFFFLVKVLFREIQATFLPFPVTLH